MVTIFYILPYLLAFLQGVQILYYFILSSPSTGCPDLIFPNHFQPFYRVSRFYILSSLLDLPQGVIISSLLAILQGVQILYSLIPSIGVQILYSLIPSIGDQILYSLILSSPSTGCPDFIFSYPF